MHVCAKCEKRVSGVEELTAGCKKCGSRAFVHRKEDKKKDEIENVKIIEKGVYEIDIDRAAKNPLVVLDNEDVYRVRMPNPNGARKVNGILKIN